MLKFDLPNFELFISNSHVITWLHSLKMSLIDMATVQIEHIKMCMNLIHKILYLMQKNDTIML